MFTKEINHIFKPHTLQKKNLKVIIFQGLMYLNGKKVNNVQLNKYSWALTKHMKNLNISLSSKLECYLHLCGVGNPEDFCFSKDSISNDFKFVQISYIYHSSIPPQEIGEALISIESFDYLQDDSFYNPLIV